MALVRLDWRARGERVEDCRPPTEEEIAGRPPHMRPREICEGRVRPYSLRVVVDRAVVVDDTIHGAGAREDRPLYVAREIAVRPGVRELRIDFESLSQQPLPLVQALLGNCMLGLHSKEISVIRR